MTLSSPQPARHPNPTTKAAGLAYLVFDRPDIDKAEAFLNDFGLRVTARHDDRLFFRGAGSAPFCYVVRKAKTAAFAGFGLRVTSEADLDALAELPDASLVEPLDGPGGGYRVRLVDPSGFQVDAVWGQLEVPPEPHRPPLPLNSVEDMSRINATQRPPIAPPEVVRLAHLVLEVADYQTTCAWYTQHFGFIPTDVQILPDGSPAVAFMRVDLGSTPTDHHTFVLAQSFAPTYSHSAFELVDVDAVAMGQRVLRERGWLHAWGMGRHILGSQIFDYWNDPWGDKHEHYCDGDVFTADVPTAYHAVSREAMAQWGPAMPKEFTRPKITMSSVSALIHNLRHSPDVSIAKIKMLAKLFA